MTWINRKLIFAKKISKRPIIFFLFFTDLHMGHQKVSKSKFQFSIKPILLFFVFLLIVSIGDNFWFLSFLDNINFRNYLFSKMRPNFWWYMWKSVKVEWKSTDFLAKVYSLFIHYLVQLIKHPILQIPNFNFPNLRCCKVVLSFWYITSYIGIFGCILILI